eukprot:COSAG01_NODE_64265_length_277_cov_0.584270_1_plen_39_part_10
MRDWAAAGTAGLLARSCEEPQSAYSIYIHTFIAAGSTAA